jgi:flavin reductase (DIM6/NTAB) family NADH-FMN oxidoreductase RutF
MKQRASRTSTASPDEGWEDDDRMADNFRRAMRRMTGTISLVTTRDDQDAPHGMAASAVVPVSMQPPSLLVSVNRSALMYSVLSTTGVFCANILDDTAHPLVEIFKRSDRRGERFLSGAWQRSWRGLPFLPSALCCVFCAVDAQMDYGTHTLLVGRVGQVLVRDSGMPLLWGDGAFVSVVPFETG